MERYQPNLHDGSTIPDAAGTDLPDWQSAWLETVRRAGEILKWDAQRLALGEDWRIEVADQTGLILFQLTFRVVEVPVMQRSSGTER
jgi:hypothetical protein